MTKQTTILFFFLISGIAISGTCVGTYDTSSIITSPNYPQQYGNAIDCEWLISSPDANNLLLSFLDFETGWGDILKVYDIFTISTISLDILKSIDIHGSLVGTYSGSTPSPIVSNGKNMYLRFTSNSYRTYRGFKIGVSGKYKYYVFN